MTVNRSYGFTLIEVAALLVILGTISAVVIAKASSVNTFKLNGEVEMVKNHLRYAQTRAMKSNCKWGIKFGTSTTYWLFQTSDTSKKKLPGEQHNEVTLSSLVINSPLRTIAFDSFGSPGTSDTTVSTIGGNISVTANTGFIP